MLAVAAALALAGAALPADAALVSCERGAAEFQARMEAVPGASRLSMRFALQLREPGRRARRVGAPGFDGWTTAAPGVTRYLYTRRVEELIGPARYRVKVGFRWADAAGRTVARARRSSRTCRQADLRPDLEVAELSLTPDGFVALVRNAGRGAAGPFAVRVGDAEVTLDFLGARRERRVEIAGSCDGHATAEADPRGAVEERSERNNALTIACPGGV